MPKELYNEGRILGYSAYEEYVKHSLSENPNVEPASEREWLASTLGNGTSMLLKVRADVMHNKLHYIDYPLPENSLLGSANTIIGNLFLGQAECDEIGWATKITDYGAGISNTAVTSPSTTDDATDYESFTLQSWIEDKGSHKENFKTTPTYQYTVNDGYENNTVSYDNVEGKSKPAAELIQYLKIQDGLVLQPGDWFNTDSGNPYKDMAPNTLEVPVVRLVFANVIKSDFYLLLTAFADRKVLTGISGLDGSTDTDKPQNGDFLGPAVYPWANKIVFTYPPSAEYYLRKSMYSRYNNLAINQDDEKLGIEFVSSHIIADEGVSVCGPSEPGGDIKISSRIRNDSNNYIKVTHGALNKEDCTKSGSIDSSEHQTDEHYTTAIEHGQIYVDRGIAIRLPRYPGENIYISNTIKSTNKMVDVKQRRLPQAAITEFFQQQNNIAIDKLENTKFKTTGTVPQYILKDPVTGKENDETDPDITTTILTVSEIHSANNSGITIEGPETAGETIHISAPIEVEIPSRSDPDVVDKRNWMYIRKAGVEDDSKTIITPLSINAGNGIIVDGPLPYDDKKASFESKPFGRLPLGNNPEITINVDPNSLKFGTNADGQTLQEILKSIIERLNGTFDNGKISWNIAGTAGIGNMNIYSTDDKIFIKCHKDPLNGDLKVN